MVQLRVRAEQIPTCSKSLMHLRQLAIVQTYPRNSVQYGRKNTVGWLSWEAYLCKGTELRITQVGKSLRWLLGWRRLHREKFWCSRKIVQDFWCPHLCLRLVLALRHLLTHLPVGWIKALPTLLLHAMKICQTQDTFQNSSPRCHEHLCLHLYKLSCSDNPYSILCILPNRCRPRFPNRWISGARMDSILVWSYISWIEQALLWWYCVREPH